MPKKLSALTAATAAALADQFGILKSGTSQRLSFTNLLASAALQSSESQSGFAELADIAEMEKLLDAAKIVTPQMLGRNLWIPYGLNICEDWISGIGIAGSHGWQSYAGGTGAAVAKGPQTEHDEDTFGIVELLTGSTTTGLAVVFLSTPDEAFTLTDGSVVIVAKLRLQTLSDAANAFTVYVGLGDNIAGSDFANGVYFRYSHSLSGGNWQYCTANASTRTQNDSGVAATTSYVELAAIVNAAGTSVEFFINGASVGTITTNIPTVEMDTICQMQKSAGTTGRRAYVDYFGFRKLWTGARY